MRVLRSIIIIGLAVLVGSGVFFAFFRKADCTQPPPGQPEEVEITRIELADPLDRRSAEISGMDWYGDYLILLPQYLDHADGRVLYAIPKSEVIDYLQDPLSPPIQAIQIPVEDQSFGEDDLEGFEGYEGIAFLGDQIFLTVEVRGDDGMVGYLISGKIEPDLSRVVLDTQGRQPIPLQQQVNNLSDEALLAVDGQIITFFEANGVAVNPAPIAQVFDLDLNPIGQLPFPSVEYRITDATRLDSDGKFWVLNTYTLGTPRLRPGQDQLAVRFGEGCTHAYYFWVERLVQMHYDRQSGITLTDQPPIQLVLQGDFLSRNWEGVVRLDDRGFLIASDKFPATILAFVPLQ